MEEILFNQLCSNIPEHRLKTIVQETVKQNKLKFFELFKENAQNEFPGFRNVKSVPLGLLSQKIQKECQDNPIVAQTLLEEWYLLKRSIVFKVKEKLEELSYKWKEPDFKSLTISFEYLREEHSTCINDLCYANYLSQGADDEELFIITLISIILGWFPSKENKMSENKTSPTQTTELSDHDDSIDEMMKRVNFLYDSIQVIKTELNSLFVKFSDSLASGRQILFEETHLSLIRKYNNTRVDFLELAEKIYNLFRGETLLNTVNTMGTIQLDLNHDSPSIVKQKLFDYYEKFIESINNVVKEKLVAINDLILLIEPEDRLMLDEKLQEIQTSYISDRTIVYSQSISNQLSEIEISLRQDIDSYNLDSALNDFETKSSKRAEKYILDFFKDNNSTSVDQLIFFLFLLPEKISLSIELKNYLLKYLIKFLAELNREQLVLYISEDTLHRVILETEEGKKLLVIFAIILYTMNARELATSIIYKEGIYDSVQDFRSIMHIVDLISKGQDLKFYDSKIEDLKKSEELLEGYFSKNSKYQEITSGIEKKYKIVLDSKILPELENIYLQIKGSKDPSVEQILINRISSPGYSAEIYQRYKTDLPKNYSLEKKIEKIIEKILEEIKTYYNNYRYEQEFSKKESIPSNILESDLENFFDSFKILSPLEKTLTDILSGFRKDPDNFQINSSIKYDSYVASLILNSIFFAKFSPEIFISINENKLNINEMYQIIKNNLKARRDLKNEIEKLRSSHCYKALELLSDLIEGNENSLITDLKKKDIEELEQIENFLKENNKILSAEYYYLKAHERFKYCKNLLINERKSVLDDKKKSSEILAQKFNDLQKISAKTRYDLTDEKDRFSEQTYGQILEALSIVDEISHQKKENRINLANELLKEIEHLRQFNNESLDQLNKIIIQYSENEINTGFEDPLYLNMPLIDVVKCLQNDDYLSLGLTKQQWSEISTDRKEYILDLLQKWLYLKDKPSTKEDIRKGKFDLGNIENEFAELLKNLFSICSLYKTNDTKRIGQDPMLDWNYSTDLPFIYTSRLQSPRCSSLDKQIHFYVLTELQTSSKKYIIRIKDFISEKQYDQTAFNVIVLLDSRERFEKINTYSLTKNLPVLDEYALKRIIFSVSENRLPKWQFVSLLTLNRKISTIQPFKTQGSVDNNTGIFVGRSEIIKEITSSKKDFAIYGGRKIGKSSLLSVISENLLKNDYAISLQSFQGIDNPLTVAKSILEDLKNAGLKSTSLIPIDSLDDFSFNLLALHRENEAQKVVIILDEMDELIHKERKVGRHQIIEIFRNISHKTNHQWRFIFAGFKEMYLEIRGKGVYEHWKNPWQNFVDDSNMQLSEIESPRELIDEGLKDILGLEYEKEIIDLITKYSTGHPAFLQKFCECLVKSIDNRISIANRRIYKKDVIDVFEKDKEFINFVKGTLDLNLSILQELITVVAAMEDKEVFTSNWISAQIQTYVEVVDKKKIIDPQELDLQLELLTITGIIKRTINRDEYRFTHPYYIIILKRLDIIDRNLIEDLINKICEQDEF